MERDLRETKLYREIEEFFRRIHEPAFGRTSGATDAEPSPDGRLIAFTGSRLDRLEGEPVTRVCVASVEGGTFEEVTGGPNSDRLPRWSPDGRRLAFLSDREEQGRNRLYLLDRDRVGEAIPAPDVDGSVEYHAWSPNGSRILLGVAGRGAELAGVQGSGTVKSGADDSPSWLPSVETSSHQAGWRALWIYEPEAGEMRRTSREGLNVWEAAWCGDSGILAIASDGPGEESWYTAPLALIDPATGKERILLESDVQLGLPAAAPSGRRVAVVQALCSDRLVVAGELLLLDPENGAATPVDTMGVDVTHVAWRDETRLLFTGLRGMDVVVGEHDTGSGLTAERWVTNESCGFVYPEARPLADEGFVVVLDSYDRHPEVTVIRDGEARVIASLAHDGSRHLDAVSGKIERTSWRATDGLEIEGLLVRPEGSEPHPMIVWVHGGPVSATRNRRAPFVALLASRGYAVLMPNPRGSSGRGRAFAEMVYGDMGGGDADDILAGVQAMVDRGVADPARLGVTGGSYGGFMSCWLVTRTDRFAAAVSFSPVTDWYSQHFTSNIGFWDGQILDDEIANPGGEYFRRSPLQFAERVTTPTLLTAGLDDECTPPGQAVEFYRALREHGVDAHLALYPGEGHGVRKFPALIDFATRAVGWFERHMPPNGRVAD
jgi:dipeptidyl aminopeptidase/acylaminoacyl peptidase